MYPDHLSNQTTIHLSLPGRRELLELLLEEVAARRAANWLALKWKLQKQRYKQRRGVHTIITHFLRWSRRREFSAKRSAAVRLQRFYRGCVQAKILRRQRAELVREGGYEYFYV